MCYVYKSATISAILTSMVWKMLLPPLRNVLKGFVLFRVNFYKAKWLQFEYVMTA